MKPDASKLSRTLFNNARALLFAALATFVSVALLAPVPARAQTKKPISKDGLVNAVKINGLSTAELVQEIRTRGVAFEMTAEVEAEMRQAGARPEVIEAAREDYLESFGDVTEERRRS